MKRIYTFIAFCLACIPAMAQEAETDTVKRLKEVLISANYLADEKTPISFQNVSLPILQMRNVGQEPSFLLSETPSFTVYSDAGSYQGYSYFFLRGIDQTRINMTLDGIPLNEPEDQGVYFSNYPDFFNSIGSIQIQRGVGTTQNGVASYAGSIQFTSPNLLDSTQTNIGLGYGSFNTFRAFAEHQSGLKDNKAFYVRASKLYSDGFKYHSTNSSESIFASGAIYGEKSTWRLTGFSGWQRNDMAWIGVSQAEIDQDPRTNRNTREENDNFRQTLVSLQNISNIGEDGILRTGIYYNYLKGNYDLDFYNLLGLPSNDTLNNIALQSDFGGLFSNFSLNKKRLTWTTGLHLNSYQRTHIGTEVITYVPYQNKGIKQEASVFSKISVQPAEKLILFADLQFRTASFDYEGDVALDKYTWDFFNPKAGLSYLVSKHLTAYYSVGRTGREPTRTDMFIGSDNLGTDSLGNPVLGITDAEYVVDHELGVRWRCPIVTLSLNGFWMEFEDEITLGGAFGPNGLALNNKVAKSRRTGIELSAEVRANKQLTFVNATSIMQTRIKDGGRTFQHVLTPDLIINQQVIYQIKNWDFGLSARYQSGAYIDLANEYKLDDYFLLNANVGVKLNKWQFSVLLNNVLDTEYYNNGNMNSGSPSYFIQAPFNLFGQAVFSF